MILKVQPSPKLKGKVYLPSSKSYSIRAFLIAALGGQSSIVNPSDCDDALIAKSFAESIGAQITSGKNNNLKIKNTRRKISLKKFNVKESGTVLRIILPLVSLSQEKAVIAGEGTLRGRPNTHLVKALRKMGLKIQGKGRGESIPITISGGKLRGGKIEIDGTLSSQFISSLLISAPLLEERSILHVKGKKLVSSDYITMTLQVLRKSGIQIKQQGVRKYIIKGNQKYQGLKNFDVPADYGLAAFLLGAAALSYSNLTLRGNLSKTFIQADQKIMDILKKMGVRFVQSSKSIAIKGPFNLKGGTFSLKDCPDLVPIVTVLALFARGKTRMTNIGHARAKESDRISDLKNELLKLGAKIKESKNEMIVYPQMAYRSHCLLDPHRDHRLAMAFIVLGLKLGVRVKDSECITKSYPKFISDLKNVGAKVRYV